MSSAWGPSHLLFLDEPLRDELVDRRFHKARRYPFAIPMTLPVIDVPAAGVDERPFDGDSFVFATRGLTGPARR
jgi:hypothetical protein